MITTRSKFYNAVKAGICISLGCTAYLLVDNKYIGTILFSIGLFSIISLKYYLFTGMTSELIKTYPIINNKIETRFEYIITLIIVWIGNLVGAAFSVSIISLTHIYDIINPKAIDMINNKISNTYMDLFLLSIFCGICIYIAIKINKSSYLDIFKLFAIVISVSVFVLCSFEHCVADMFYFLVAGSIDFKAFICLLVITAGNIIGSLVLPILEDKYDQK